MVGSPSLIYQTSALQILIHVWVLYGCVVLSGSWAAAILPAVLWNTLVQKREYLTPCASQTYELLGADWEMLLLKHPSPCDLYRFHLGCPPVCLIIPSTCLYQLPSPIPCCGSSHHGSVVDLPLILCAMGSKCWRDIKGFSLKTLKTFHPVQAGWTWRLWSPAVLQTSCMPCTLLFVMVPTMFVHQLMTEVVISFFSFHIAVLWV